MVSRIGGQQPRRAQEMLQVVVLGAQHAAPLRSTATFRVATRLVTVTTGGTPTGNSAATSPSASSLRSTKRAFPPGALNVIGQRLW